VPTGSAIRQSVLSDKPHSQSLDATRVETFGQREIGQVSGEVSHGAD